MSWRRPYKTVKLVKKMTELQGHVKVSKNYILAVPVFTPKVEY